MGIYGLVGLKDRVDLAKSLGPDLILCNAQVNRNPSGLLTLAKKIARPAGCCPRLPAGDRQPPVGHCQPPAVWLLAGRRQVSWPTLAI